MKKIKPRRHNNGMMAIRKTDRKKQIVYGEVYVPNEVDSQGEMMLADDIEEMAHHFLKEATLSSSIDTHHNNWPNGSYPVESFIAKNHPEWPDGAWVLGVKIPSKELWKKIEKGEIGGFSFEGMARKQRAVLKMHYTPHVMGYTEPDPEDGHIHTFVCKVNANGKVVGGHTSVINGHRHHISKGTATDEQSGHKHRFFLQHKQ